mgnify:FL=1
MATRTAPAGRAGDEVDWGRRGRVPLAVVLLALGLLVGLPLATIFQINRLSQQLQGTVVPARETIAALQTELAIEVTALRAFLLIDDPEYRRQYGEAHERRTNALAAAVDLMERLDPEIQAAFEVLQRALDGFDAIADAVFGGAITREGYSESLLDDQNARFLTALEATQAIDEALLEIEVDLVDRFRRTILLGFAVECGLVLVALVAAVQAVGLARRYRLVAMDLKRAVEERDEVLRRERAARAEAERQREELRRVTESRARLIRGFGHDLKNPLVAADGHLQLLARSRARPLPEEEREHLDRARRSLHRALDLLDSLLEFGRAEAGEVLLELAPLDPGELVVEVAEEYRARAEEKGLTLETEVPEGLPTLISDRRRIGQILGNFLSNAVKYTVRGRIAVGARCQEGADARVGLFVSDTGPGIAPEDRERVFEEFHRLGREGEGAGIGLAFSSLLAGALGGSIELESEVGAGSTFTLWLPLRPSQGSPQGAGRLPVSR